MSNKEPIDISAFATRQLSLLDKELQAEVAESSAVTQSHSPKALSRAGLAILNLTVVSQRTGLGGKTVLELGLDGAVANDDAFSDHGLRVGDIARLGVQPKGSERKLERDAAEKLGVNCVLVKSTANAVQVALDKEDADVPSGRLWLCVTLSDMFPSYIHVLIVMFSVDSNLQMMSRIKGICYMCKKCYHPLMVIE